VKWLRKLLIWFTIAIIIVVTIASLIIFVNTINTPMNDFKNEVVYRKRTYIVAILSIFGTIVGSFLGAYISGMTSTKNARKQLNLQDFEAHRKEGLTVIKAFSGYTYLFDGKTKSSPSIKDMLKKDKNYDWCLKLKIVLDTLKSFFDNNDYINCSTQISVNFLNIESQLEFIRNELVELIKSDDIKAGNKKVEDVNPEFIKQLKIIYKLYNELEIKDINDYHKNIEKLLEF
jgi:uncharacterized protein YpmB